MIQATLNAIFSFGALMLAAQCARKGLPFMRTGWGLIASQTAYPDFRENVERRRTISDGGRFLIAGIGWLALTAGLGIAAVYFGVLAFRLTYGLG